MCTTVEFEGVLTTNPEPGKGPAHLGCGGGKLFIWLMQSMLI
ncbi:MAG: hypothetical protein ACXADU_15630 [Promethearchaeota archaeon]